MGEEDAAEVPVSDVGVNWEVYGADGQKIGEVNEIHDNYIWVQRGLLFPEDMYIPLSACVRAEPDKVFLNVTADGVRAAGWHTLPAVIASTGTADIAGSSASEESAGQPTSGPEREAPAEGAPSGRS